MTTDVQERPVAVHPRLRGRHKVILLLLLGTQFMLAVDFSILNVALPAIGDGLHLRLDSIQWVATAFALPAAGFTLLSAGSPICSVGADCFSPDCPCWPRARCSAGWPPVPGCC